MKPRAPRPIIRVLPNGVRIAFDPMEGVRSCAIGIWAEIGSRLERPPERGLTHFIEHMLFKGTP
ncbi:insulinase family protein, partial [Candidatus Sumerlaeota bacterium]|nr:insulinase family protein [Candidatus Sumerlaeota bacterium]